MWKLRQSSEASPRRDALLRTSCTTVAVNALEAGNPRHARESNRSGGLLFYQWLLRRVYADMPLPGDAELKELRNAFVRVFDAFKARTRPLAEDMDLVAKWTDGDDAAMGRALGRTVRFYREKAGLTRLQLAKKAGLPMRLIVSLERGTMYSRIRTAAIPKLAKGLGVDGGDFTDTLMDFEKDNTMGKGKPN